MSEKILPEIKNVEIVAKSRLFEVESIDLQFANGAERTYERLVNRRGSAVIIAAMADDEHVYLVREYAGGVHAYELGLPKGLVEHSEDILVGANRELMEEVGYRANSIQRITTFSTSPGYLSSQMHLILAKDLEPEKLQGDEPEELEIIKWNINKLDELLQRDDVNDARTIAALFMVREHFRTYEKLVQACEKRC